MPAKCMGSIGGYRGWAAQVTSQARLILTRAGLNAGKMMGRSGNNGWKTTLIPTEYDEQTRLMTWAKSLEGGIPELRLLVHIPNGSKAHISYRLKLKQLGLRAGFPDLCLPVARGGYHGLFIEMKRLKGGVTTKDQKAWHHALRDEGFLVRVAKGWIVAANVLLDYLDVSGEGTDVSDQKIAPHT